MGQQAEDRADGTVCIECGTYFIDEDNQHACFTHGFPVACKKCFRAGMKKDGVQKATAKSANFYG